MAPVVNTRGPLFVHPKGVVRRTHFHVMSMYANRLQPNQVECWVDCEDLERPDLPVVFARLANLLVHGS